GLDVAPPALVDLDARVLEHPDLQLLLAHQQQLADRGVVALQERVATLRAVDRGGLQELPPVEDRLGVDLRRAAPGGADRERRVRALAAAALAEPAEDRAGDHLRDRKSTRLNSSHVKISY